MATTKAPQWMMLAIFLCQLLPASYAQNKQTIGFGGQGNVYFSPLVTGKKYYGAYGSLNIRNSQNSYEFKVYMGVQFNKDIQVVDFGSTFRFLPTKKLVYIGISPFSYRLATLKSTLDDPDPTSNIKFYGAGHLGLQLPLGKAVNFEIESNYSYFYSQKTGGFGMSVGFVFFNNDLVSAAADSYNKSRRY
ncbi:MAG: hypothetical protein IPG86_13225 [Chitinophagaceae bacterium]|nr:hypothetical protein [Chitinophagaceae bacterium]